MIFLLKCISLITAYYGKRFKGATAFSSWLLSPVKIQSLRERFTFISSYDELVYAKPAISRPSVNANLYPVLGSPIVSEPEQTSCAKAADWLSA